MPLHRAALTPDVDAEVLIGRTGGMRDVETALRISLPPFVTQANPDADVGIRDRLSGVGGNNLEVEHAAGLDRGRPAHRASAARA